MNKTSFSLLNKSKTDKVLPELYDILYNNMSVIAPSGNNYEDDKQSWIPCITSALEKPQRQIILISQNTEIIGFFMYYVNNQILMMEEIQLKPKYHGSGIFNELYKYLFHILNDKIDFVEAYSNKQNIKSQNILVHLGLECIGENKNGNSFHYRGVYKNMKEKILHAQSYRKNILKHNEPLYHGSNVGDLTELHPFISEHNAPYVYFSENPVVALLYAVHPTEKPVSYYPFGFDNDGTVHYSEYYLSLIHI